jgi:hypothetical protein
MTEEEIQAAREEIVSAMSLEAVEFIRKRSAKLESTPHSRTGQFCHGFATNIFVQCSPTALFV